jgi:hypothetical protein
MLLWYRHLPLLFLSPLLLYQSLLPPLFPSRTKDPVINPTEPTSDTWDPWKADFANNSQALVVYEPSQNKRKTPSKVRHSARLQNKLPTGAKSKVPTTSGSSF